MVENDQKDQKDQSWVTLEGVANEAEAALLAGFLESEGIPARVVDRSFHLAPMPEDDELSPIAVTVPADRLAEAEQLLASRETDAAAPDTEDPAGPGGSEGVG